MLVGKVSGIFQVVSYGWKSNRINGCSDYFRVFISLAYLRLDLYANQKQAFAQGETAHKKAREVIDKFENGEIAKIKDPCPSYNVSSEPMIFRGSGLRVPVHISSRERRNHV